MTIGTIRFLSVMPESSRFSYAIICLSLLLIIISGCSSDDSSGSYSSARMAKTDWENGDFPQSMEAGVAVSSIPQPPDFPVQPGLSDQEPTQKFQQKANAAQMFNEENRLNASIQTRASFVETNQNERIVVASSTLNMTVADLNQTISRLTEIVLGFGGWVVSSDIKGAAGAVLVARVPAKDLAGIVTVFIEWAIVINTESLDSIV